MRGSGAFRSVDLASLVLGLPLRSSSEAVAQTRLRRHRRSTVKPAREGSGGVIGSENVDMSSDKAGERPARRKSKGSCLKLI